MSVTYSGYFQGYQEPTPKRVRFQPERFGPVFVADIKDYTVDSWDTGVDGAFDYTATCGPVTRTWPWYMKPYTTSPNKRPDLELTVREIH